MNAIIPPSSPRSAVDPYIDDLLLDPWPTYRALQAQGPAVWLDALGMYALTRHSSVSKALQTPAVFISSLGVMMNDDMNMVLRGNTLCSDGADHDALRKVIVKPLTAGALRSLQDDITREANDLVDRVFEKRRFCAVSELAVHLPVTIVANAIGLPAEGREQMLHWAEQCFNCFGPMNERTRQAFPVLQEMMDYATTQAVPGKLKPGSWAEAVHHAADRGEVPHEGVPVMMIDYMAPSLDTTIFGIANGIWLFANNPDQWDLVREEPALINSAINEILRMEAPIQSFSRYVAEDYDMDGVLLSKGSRAIVFYGAANRDEREYPDPDRFDVRRNPTNHLAFGAGPHMCLGLNLAKLEMRTLFTRLAHSVRRFHVEESERAVNNVLRGFRKLIVSVE